MAKYNFQTIIKFKSEEINGKISQTMRFRHKSREITLQIPEKAVAIKIYELLKKKLNLSGFHKLFRGIKLIGSGHFAKVYIFLTINIFIFYKKVYLIQSINSEKFYAAKALLKKNIEAKKNSLVKNLPSNPIINL